MQPIQRFSSHVVLLPIDNIDTDQIIPARFLKVTDKAGLGDALFADWRYDDAGAPRPAFVLNRPDAAGAEVLICGDNFGCGSSREHAPWALMGYGFRAVISTWFADIFRTNALKNGLLPIVVEPAVHRRLMELLEADPVATVAVDLDACTLTLPDDSSVPFPVDPFARHCLLNGIDELGFLMGEEHAIAEYEATHAAPVTTTVNGSDPS